MLMRQDGASDNRKIRIGADRVVREHLNKLKQTNKGIVLNLHRHMIAGQHDAMLIVINVRTVLHVPLLPGKRQRKQPDVLSCRMIQSARITHILRAEKALRILLLLLVQSSRNRLGILLRLGKIDRNVQLSVAGLRHPLAVLPDPVGADIVTVTGKLVEIICGLLRALLIFLVEGTDHVGRSGCQTPHQPRIKQITACNSILNHTSLCGIIQQISKNILECRKLLFLRKRSLSKLSGWLKLHGIHKEIFRIITILLRDQILRNSISNKSLHCSFRRLKYHSVFPLILATFHRAQSPVLFYGICSLLRSPRISSETAKHPILTKRISRLPSLA